MNPPFIHAVAQVMQVKQWRWVHHHEAHALLGFLSSPFQRALVVSYDGGGDDGTYNAFYGTGQTVQRVARLDATLGSRYGWGWLATGNQVDHFGRSICKMLQIACAKG